MHTFCTQNPVTSIATVEGHQPFTMVPAIPGGMKGGMPTLPGDGALPRRLSSMNVDHEVQIHAGGKCAVVTYFFPITFAVGTEKQTLQGRDIFFLIRQGWKWLVAADQCSPEPPTAGSARP